MKKYSAILFFTAIIVWIILAVTGCTGGSSGDGGSVITPTPSPSVTTTPTSTPTITPTPTPTPTVSGNVHALIIGIDDYPGTGEDLEYCVNDATDYKGAFENCNMWSRANITMLLDTQGTKSDIQNAITNAKNTVESDDLFVMTFSGHGTNIDDDAAIIVWENGNEGYITDDELAQWLSGMPCPMVIYIDSCSSGGMIGKDPVRIVNGVKYRSRLRTDVPGYNPFFKGTFNPSAYLDRGLESVNRIVVLTATADEEIADENSELQNGLFTYYTVQGLGSGSGMGPADANNSGSITAVETFNYCSPRVVDYSEGDQNPQIADNYPSIENPDGSLVVKE
ncbi:MAG: caspase family protein [Candidatus Eremiobacteraeota bacterium]|nr:caspase family protein [Candidatus Eremiobacteraeota bacterium]